MTCDHAGALSGPDGIQHCPHCGAERRWWEGSRSGWAVPIRLREVDPVDTERIWGHVFPVYPTPSVRLDELRRRMGWTLDFVARRLRVTVHQVVKLEQGSLEPIDWELVVDRLSLSEPVEGP